MRKPFPPYSHCLESSKCSAVVCKVYDRMTGRIFSRSYSSARTSDATDCWSHCRSDRTERRGCHRWVFVSLGEEAKSMKFNRSWTSVLLDICVWSCVVHKKWIHEQRHRQCSVSFAKIRKRAKNFYRWLESIHSKHADQRESMFLANKSDQHCTTLSNRNKRYSLSWRTTDTIFFLSTLEIESNFNLLCTYHQSEVGRGSVIDLGK